jgi:hypothetical protein
MIDQSFSDQPVNLAMMRAVAVLVAQPNVKIAVRRRIKPWDAAGFEKEFDYSLHPEETAVCQVLADDYRESLKLERGSTSLASFIREMSDIEQLSNELANKIKSLRHDSRFLLTTVWDDDESVFERLSDLQEKVVTLPHSTDDNGRLVDQLESIRDFFKAYRPELEKRFGGTDGKFRPNSPRLWHAATRSPIWKLITDAWAACLDYPHLRAKNGVSPLHGVLVVAIHEWVTQDNKMRFAKTLKKYRSMQKRKRELDGKGGPAAAKALEELEFRLHHEFYPNELRSHPGTR